jgi:class 3 adenylate cyclase
VLNELIERYFSAFLDEVAEQGGNVNETMGDGFMAIFHRFDPVENALRAAEAALALLGTTERLNAENPQEPMEVHVGISSGMALVGSTQFEGRYGARWVFSASGHEVNVAARLAGIAKASQILISVDTARLVADRYPLESQGIQKLKNMEGEIETFRLIKRG